MASKMLQLLDSRDWSKSARSNSLRRGSHTAWASSRTFKRAASYGRSGCSLGAGEYPERLYQGIAAEIFQKSERTSLMPGASTALTNSGRERPSGAGYGEMRPIGNATGGADVAIGLHEVRFG